MYHVCPECGELTVNPDVDGDALVCSRCGTGEPFRRLPLWHLIGASGAGKTTTSRLVRKRVTDHIVVDGDTFWGLREDWGGHGFPEWRDFCLTVAYDIGQSGRPVLWVGATVPHQTETRPGRRWFADTHYLALVCDDDVLEARLRARPAWRGSARAVDEHFEYNQWLKDNGPDDPPGVRLVDTTHEPPERTATHVLDWLAGD